MSKDLNYKQVVNVERRTWDREYYQARADARRRGLLNEGEAAGETNNNKSSSAQEDEEKEEFLPAGEGSVGPPKSERAYLKARQRGVDLDSKIGTTEIINPADAARTKARGEGLAEGVTRTASGVGWHCKVCDIFLKDSLNYLDHINGRRHQKSLGYSMRVERSTKEQVAAQLASLVAQNEEKKKKEEDEEDFIHQENLEDVVRAKDEERRRKKEERRAKRKRKQQQKQQQRKHQQEGDDEEEEFTIKIQKRDHVVKEEHTIKQEEPTENESAQEEEEPGAAIDPNIALMMGFGGFGGSNKNR